MRKSPQFKQSKQKLETTGQEYRYKKILNIAHVGDRYGTEGGQSCCRTTDTQFGFAQKGDYHASDHSGNQAGIDGRIGCQRNAEAKRKGDKKYRDAGFQVVADQGMKVKTGFLGKPKGVLRIKHGW